MEWGASPTSKGREKNCGSGMQKKKENLKKTRGGQAKQVLRIYQETSKKVGREKVISHTYFRENGWMVKVIDPRGGTRHRGRW